ncbi:hypothetical protein HYW53_03495 [Candidatus Giovannonibacteria bacterium]|nr:hypothetical protein [Candidatus Giovannonibacteria bacterium]
MEINAKHSCPICQTGLEPRKELLFCNSCNLFVGRLASYEDTFNSDNLLRKLSYSNSVASNKSEKIKIVQEQSYRLYAVLGIVALLALIAILIF